MRNQGLNKGSLILGSVFGAMLAMVACGNAGALSSNANAVTPAQAPARIMEEPCDEFLIDNEGHAYAQFAVFDMPDVSAQEIMARSTVYGMDGDPTIMNPFVFKANADLDLRYRIRDKTKLYVTDGMAVYLCNENPSGADDTVIRLTLW